MILNATNQYLPKLQVLVIPNFTNKELLSGLLLVRGKSMESNLAMLWGSINKDSVLSPT